ncbi:c-type cytochrome [Luteimonas sp. e5]
MNKHDAVFLKKFSLIIGLLALVTLGFILLARHVHKLLPPEITPQAQAQTAARIAPVGAVYAGAEGAAAAHAANQLLAKAAAGADAPFGGSTDGKVVYDGLCHACHTAGTGGAPMLNAAGMGARLAEKGMELLHTHAIDGFTGNTGIMPARGGMATLTDAQVMAAVDYMVEQSK